MLKKVIFWACLIIYSIAIEDCYNCCMEAESKFMMDDGYLTTCYDTFVGVPAMTFAKTMNYIIDGEFECYDYR